MLVLSYDLCLKCALLFGIYSLFSSQFCGGISGLVWFSKRSVLMFCKEPQKVVEMEQVGVLCSRGVRFTTVFVFVRVWIY